MNEKFKFNVSSKDGLREKIILETLRSIPKIGLEAISLRQIARDLEVSHQAPYTYFKTKEELFGTIRALGFETLSELVEGQLSNVPDSFERVMTLGRTAITFYAHNPGLYQIMYQPVITAKSPSPKAAAAVFAVVIREVNGLAADRKISKAKAKGIALLTWSSVHGLANLYMNGVFQRKDVAEVFTSDLDKLLEQLSKTFQVLLS